MDIAEKRHRELGVAHFLGTCRDKAEGLLAMCTDMGVSAKEVAFVGDDLVDLPAFAVCGLSVAVRDACPEMLEAADWITAAPGGRGAVREVCEVLLRASGTWQDFVRRVSNEKDRV